jgi:hypothetical protein
MSRSFGNIVEKPYMHACQEVGLLWKQKCFQTNDKDPLFPKEQNNYI